MKSICHGFENGALKNISASISIYHYRIIRALIHKGIAASQSELVRSALASYLPPLIEQLKKIDIVEKELEEDEVEVDGKIFKVIREA